MTRSAGGWQQNGAHCETPKPLAMNLDRWNLENLLTGAIFDLYFQCMASTLVHLCFLTFARRQHCQESSVLLIASLFPFLSTKRFSFFSKWKCKFSGLGRFWWQTTNIILQQTWRTWPDWISKTLSQPSNPPGAPAHFDVGTLDISAVGRTSAARKPGDRQHNGGSQPSADLACRAHLTTGQVPTRNKSQTSRFIKTHLSPSKMDTTKRMKLNLDGFSIQPFGGAYVTKHCKSL